MLLYFTGTTFFYSSLSDSLHGGIVLGINRIFEGDPAPLNPFENLVSIKTEKALGKAGALRVIPWLSKKQKDYLVVLTDPREKSTELRNVIKHLSGGLPSDILSRIIDVNADTPAENRR